MKYLVLMAEEDPSAFARATPEQREALLDAHRSFDREVRRRGSVVAGEALAGAETATTLRLVEGRQTLTDGPLAVTAEQLGGFYLIDVADLDTAVGLVRLLPTSYTTEIRPVVEVEGA